MDFNGTKGNIMWNKISGVISAPDPFTNIRQTYIDPKGDGDLTRNILALASVRQAIDESFEGAPNKIIRILKYPNVLNITGSDLADFLQDEDIEAIIDNAFGGSCFAFLNSIRPEEKLLRKSMMRAVINSRFNNHVMNFIKQTKCPELLSIATSLIYE